MKSPRRKVAVTAASIWSSSGACWRERSTNGTGGWSDLGGVRSGGWGRQGHRFDLRSIHGCGDEGVLDHPAVLPEPLERSRPGRRGADGGDAIDRVEPAEHPPLLEPEIDRGGRPANIVRVGTPSSAASRVIVPPAPMNRSATASSERESMAASGMTTLGRPRALIAVALLGEASEDHDRDVVAAIRARAAPRRRAGSRRGDRRRPAAAVRATTSTGGRSGGRFARGSPGRARSRRGRAPPSGPGGGSPCRPSPPDGGRPRRGRPRAAGCGARRERRRGWRAGARSPCRSRPGCRARGRRGSARRSCRRGRRRVAPRAPSGRISRSREPIAPPSSAGSVAAGADQRGVGPALAAQLEGLRVIADRDDHAAPLGLEPSADRREQQRVRRVGEVDPDLHRSALRGVEAASRRVSASSIGACTQRTCGVRSTRRRWRW